MGRLQPGRPRLLRWATSVVLVAAAAGALAREPVVAPDRRPAQAAAPVSVARFGPQADGVYRAIRAGGPFAYPKDGIVFGNRERLLPARSRGYYREYTVPTPGARDRGAKRIVCGGRVPTSPDACWYSADHYASFTPITP